MTPAEFDDLVDQVLEDLPEQIVAAFDNVIVVVEEEPTAEQDPHGEGLLGLYEGVNLAERGDYWGAMPDQITIFRLPHLRLGLSDAELREEIRKTVIHEVLHHLGYDDEELPERWA